LILVDYINLRDTLDVICFIIAEKGLKNAT